MKIHPSDSIRIMGKALPAETLRAIPKGTELPARIVERLGAREAIIELAGNRIRAEFLRGVPPDVSITLRLEDSGKNAYIFKLIDPAVKEELARLVLELTFLKKDAIGKTALHELNAAMSKHPAGILQLNALLMGRDLKEFDRGLTRFLGHLLRLGMPAPALGDLSMLLSGINIGSGAVRALLLALGFNETALRRWTSLTGSGHGDAVDSIMKGLEAIDDPEERVDVMRRLVILLNDKREGQPGQEAGEFAIHHDGEFHAVRYLGYGGSWIFNVDFSKIGLIEILAREAGKDYSISIFSENQGVIDALKKSGKNLAENCAKIHSGIYINFYNTRYSLNKMVEINSYYSKNSVVDIRV
ncbi:MAG: hypothetical protein E4G96_08560 [Chrysiogenales bacterium]|nr:MAG: hypothetical protein E4G96_08560 [Chrysiogenales bacterium]